MTDGATIENGFAEVGAGTWLMGRGQPAAFFGEARRSRLKGWIVRDRAALELVETTGRSLCADASRPFLTHIPCAAALSAVSGRILVAPACARTGAETVRTVPMNARGSIAVTRFGGPEEAGAGRAQAGGGWVVMATASRTTRLSVGDGDTLSVRPECAVAWTGRPPTGFVRRLGVWDVILPRAPRGLMLHFHGPCVVWVEGASGGGVPRPQGFNRRAYGF